LTEDIFTTFPQTLITHKIIVGLMVEKGGTKIEMPIGFKIKPDERIEYCHISGYPFDSKPKIKWVKYDRLNVPVLLITNYRLIFMHSIESDFIDSEWLPYQKIPSLRIENDHLVIYSHKFNYKRYRQYFTFQFVNQVSNKFILVSDNMKRLQEIRDIIQSRIKQSFKKPEIKRQIVTNKLKHEVWRRDNFTCQYCGKSINEIELEIDHILPISKGGESVISNLQTLCVECNRTKSNK
jgi:5-methylcytosine-specific restriction endonuclease McrA